MKKEWKNPIVMELGVENTLCGDDSVDALPVHGNDKPDMGQGANTNNKIICPYCGHWCPTKEQSDAHIERVHGLTVTTS